MLAVSVHQISDIKAQQNTSVTSLVSSVGSPDRINMSFLPSFFSPPPQMSNKNILHKQIPNYN